MPVSPPSGKLRLSALLMILAIIGIAVFQAWWLKKLYAQELGDLKKETDIAFRDVFYKLQLENFRKDTAFAGHKLPDNLFFINLLDSLKDELPDPGPPVKGGRAMTISVERHDGKDSILRKITSFNPPTDPKGSHTVINFLASNDSAGASLRISQIDSAYRRELDKNQINIPYTIRRFTVKDMKKMDSLHLNPAGFPTDPLKTNIAYVGLSSAYGYQADFGNSTGYLLGLMKLPIYMALLLLAFITASFVFLYRNLLQQHRLAITKDEFIGNMTHELKTPIATVQVAVEALRHFNALDDPQKTMEYLDISAIELQRLSMLVDKVLRLSLFEQKAVELNRQTLDLHQLAAEVIAGMKVSFEKASATVQLTRSGDHFLIKADRMHMTSVLTNLLDNALKYSKAGPVITVHFAQTADAVIIAVADNGIGIPAAYIGRVFDKFFRVPSGDHHNIKGYGLGLSYVHHIVTRHNGSITVESKEGKGSKFIISIPT